MDEQEARGIDVILSGNTEPSWARDPAVADMLVDLLRRDEPMFIYINKQGTHWEYHDAFPPTLPYDPSRLVADLPLDAARRGSVRDYHKAVRWSVDGFFEKVLPELRRRDAVLLYTSDHGQSLYEGGYDLTHCSMSPRMHRGEVLVPLFMITASPAFAARSRTEAQRAFNRASHFEVFSTLLELMGYSADWVEKVYGPSLLNVPVERTRGFLMGTFDHPTAVWRDAE
jgi:lipid A ethanolaminephosphotransferase